MVILRIALLSSLAFLPPALADTFTVTSLDDSGPGSLRQALVDANALPGNDRIEFSPGLEGTIVLASTLPTLADDTIIAAPGREVITVSGNQAVRVFSIEPGAQVTISAVTIANGFSGFNDSTGIGGAIWNQGSLIIEDSVIRDSVAEASGGGIANDGSLTVLRCTISGNTAPPEEFAVGGGLENLGTATIIESTLAGNTADIGGAIANAQGDLLVVNSTLSGNSAAFIGGAIDNFEGSTDLLHVTVFDNDAPDAGGLNNEGDSRVRNGLLANNAGGDCLDDAGISFAASGVSFDSDGSCPGLTTATLPDLAIEALADNGGPTSTHALGEGSIAVDAAQDCTEFDGTTPVETDQRSVPRPAGDDCDAGAFELEEAVPQPDEIFSDRFEGG